MKQNVGVQTTLDSADLHYILRNGIFFHTMEANGHQKCLVTNILLPNQQKTERHKGWDDMKASK